MDPFRLPGRYQALQGAPIRKPASMQFRQETKPVYAKHHVKLRELRQYSRIIDKFFQMIFHFDAII
tara:strand:+ start:143068 stop:143265 length:198 start_codon:yes stop_codon:yes gene_type:complete